MASTVAFYLATWLAVQTQVDAPVQLDKQTAQLLIRVDAGKQAALSELRYQLERANEQLPYARAGVVDKRNETAVIAGDPPKYEYHSVEDKQRTIANLQATIDGHPQKIAELEKKPFIFPIIDAFEMQEGEIGYLDFGSYVIGGTPRTFQVLQVLDDDKMLISTGKKSRLIRGLPTKGIVDGANVTIDPVMEVTGTYTYPTAAGGTNTVFKLEPVPKQRLDELTRQLNAAVVRLEAAREAALYRTWSSLDGRFTVKAKLLDFARGKAELLTEDKRTIQVTSGQLSREDQQYIRDEIARRKAKSSK